MKLGEVWLRKNQVGSPLTRVLIVLFWVFLIALWAVILFAAFGQPAPQLPYIPVCF